MTAKGCMYKKWFAEEKRALERYVLLGLTPEEIHEKMPGRTVAQIEAKLRHMGAKPSRCQATGFLAPERPYHVKAGIATDEWWEQNNTAFVTVMREHYEEVRL